jgi:hypothetical protein
MRNIFMAAWENFLQVNIDEISVITDRNKIMIKPLLFLKPRSPRFNDQVSVLWMQADLGFATGSCIL